MVQLLIPMKRGGWGRVDSPVQDHSGGIFVFKIRGRSEGTDHLSVLRRRTTQFKAVSRKWGKGISVSHGRIG